MSPKFALFCQYNTHTRMHEAAPARAAASRPLPANAVSTPHARMHEATPARAAALPAPPVHPAHAHRRSMDTLCIEFGKSRSPP